jgi:NAD(P)-dependent dehydrogenase (short-subunit alcohol dehydrogenase family)
LPPSHIASSSNSSMANHNLYALVTGGNRGIGLEVCKQLVERKKPVILTCRKLEAGAMRGTCHVLPRLHCSRRTCTCTRLNLQKRMYLVCDGCFAGKAAAAELSKGVTDVRVMSLDTGSLHERAGSENQGRL